MPYLTYIFFAVILLVASNSFAGSDEIVIVGQKISTENITPPIGENPRRIIHYNRYQAKYKILEIIYGEYDHEQIEFTASEHMGAPGFINNEYSLLYLRKTSDGEYCQAYRQYSPLYKTQDGRLAGKFSYRSFKRAYDNGVTIQPEFMQFEESANLPASKFKPETIEEWFPEPYYKIENDWIIPVYGYYPKDLFRVNQNGVLKARGTFQE